MKDKMLDQWEIFKNFQERKRIISEKFIHKKETFSLLTNSISNVANDIDMNEEKKKEEKKKRSERKQIM